jgi:hypothetical protein
MGALWQAPAGAASELHRAGGMARGLPWSYTWGWTGRVEAPVTLVINLIIFAAIVLFPLVVAFVFMRIRRRFSSF